MSKDMLGSVRWQLNKLARDAYDTVLAEPLPELVRRLREQETRTAWPATCADALPAATGGHELQRQH